MNLVVEWILTRTLDQWILAITVLIIALIGLSKNNE